MATKHVTTARYIVQGGERRRGEGKGKGEEGEGGVMEGRASSK